MEMGAGQQWARTPWPDTRLGGSGAVRQNGTPYCRVPSSGSPGRTVHSPRSRGPGRRIQESAHTAVLTLTGGASLHLGTPSTGKQEGCVGAEACRDRPWSVSART